MTKYILVLVFPLSFFYSHNYTYIFCLKKLFNNKYCLREFCNSVTSTSLKAEPDQVRPKKSGSGSGSNKNVRSKVRRKDPDPTESSSAVLHGPITKLYHNFSSILLKNHETSPDKHVLCLMDTCLYIVWIRFPFRSLSSPQCFGSGSAFWEHPSGR